ncbi:hypothetical protein OpiT1DRAFT_02141 [Opitutaceae bacterium TAV1]|nr:hypothetical protein OpiT1DRAFT_02141 [Opitutaceae bacterium TAV1]
MKFRPFPRSLCAVAAALTGLGLASLTLPALSAATILAEDFTSDRLTSNLPTTSTWYTSGSTDNINYDTTNGGSITQTVSGTTGNLLTYFRDAGSPVSLVVGETLSVKFNFRLSGVVDANNIFRVGILNSRGSRVTADNMGSYNAIFSQYRGYAALFNPGDDNDQDGVPPASIYQRSRNNSNLINSSSAFSSDPLATGGAATVLSDDTSYTGIFSVTRTSDTAMSITFSILNGSGTIQLFQLSATDNSGNGYTDFDTFAITGMGGTSSLNSFTLENVTISVSAVPEPRSAALGMSIFICLALLCYRFPRR